VDVADGAVRDAFNPVLANRRGYRGVPPARMHMTTSGLQWSSVRNGLMNSATRSASEPGPDPTAGAAGFQVVKVLRDFSPHSWGLRFHESS
jgi:hypothetical protein